MATKDAAQPTCKSFRYPGGATDGTNSAEVPVVIPNPKWVRKTSSYEARRESTNRCRSSPDELAEAQDASDEFKMKAKVIFEGALNQKLQLEVARIGRRILFPF